MMSHSSGQYGHGPNGNSMYPSGQSQPGITVDANHNTTMGQDEKYYTPGRGYILFINNYFRGPPPHGCEQYEPRKVSFHHLMDAHLVVFVAMRYRTINMLQLLPEGAEIDRASVENLRTSLHNYEIQIEEELGQTEFWNSLKKAHTEVGGGNYSCFILIISSHGIETEITKDGQTGKKESIVLVDSSQVTVDAIRDYFDGWSAPKLVGKPKVFVIQACRGIKSARGILDRSDCNPPAQVIPTPPTQLSRPENADVLIAYSTSPGTRSWRNEQEGTWYINCLCKAIAHNKGPAASYSQGCRDLLSQSVVVGDLFSQSVVVGDLLSQSVVVGDLFSQSVVVGDLLSQSVVVGDLLSESVVVGDLLSQSVVVGDLLSQSVVVGDLLSQSVVVGDLLSQSVVVGDLLSQSVVVGDLLSQSVVVGDLLSQSVVVGDLLSQSVVVGDLFCVLMCLRLPSQYL
ncbi:putative caspase-3 [Apostichopus japonicus]|uniref:Putative caspase-3 n=1 Tax=Stichopus japonicus TaxID=307972 RepID=A0A2G8KET6_STIJA|nr:putative caspase-3 [Apostichopus japonicus]